MASGDRNAQFPDSEQYSSSSQAYNGAAEEGEQMAVRGVCDAGNAAEEASQEPGANGQDLELDSPTEAATSTSNPAQSSNTATTMDHLLNDVVSRCMLTGLAHGGAEIAHCFITASEQPPITPDSLTELDMPRIINNPRLRYDVNFDRELHFRPNLDGLKGREKMMLAENYWKALEGELFMYGFVQGRLQESSDSKDEVYWKGILAESEKRLPKVFDAIREILKSLVPDYDQNVVTERLDTDLTMQEIKNGVCDLIDLADWLAKILKNHCAPMRDPLVDRMQAEIKRGAAEAQSDTLVNGIRQLLNILEAMKLDVANHQIRHMRPLLVEDTVNFQRRYNAHRISINKVDVTRAKVWLECEMQYLTAENGTAEPLEALTSALLKDVICSGVPNLYPQTFYLDTERLQALRTDLHSAIFHGLCRDILVEVAPKTDELVKAVAHLRVKVQAIVGTSGRFEDRIEHIAAEIMRIVLMLEGKEHSFDLALLATVEERLLWEVQTGSRAFEARAKEVFDRLIPKVHASVTRHIKLSAVQLQDRLVPPVPLPPMHSPFGFGAVLEPVPTFRPTDPDDDAVRKFTHMIVLHWQVWADLVYLVRDDEDGASSSGSRTPPSPSSSWPCLIPVATAVYAPGRKWLPIGVKVEDVPSRVPSPITPATSDSEPDAAAAPANEDDEESPPQPSSQPSSKSPSRSASQPPSQPPSGSTPKTQQQPAC